MGRNMGSCPGIFFEVVFFFLVVLAGSSSAQTNTYHLHKEASTTSGLYQLKSGGPDAATTALQSGQLRNTSPGEFVIKQFDTQSGVPNVSGVIPTGSTVTFTLWMKKTSNAGTLYPRAKLNLNSASGPALCSATGGAASTTTLTKFTFACSTTANVTVTPSDRYYLWTGVYVSTSPGNQSLYGELDIEGVLNGNYDSTVAVPSPVPAPHIDGIAPDSGGIGADVSVTGSNFGATQGSSTVTFNGVTAPPTAWSDGAITVPVPPGAATGPVVVTVQGASSNGVNFTAVVGSITGTVSRASDGAFVDGARVEALQSGLVKLSATSASGGAYSLAGLAPGTYDVRASWPGYANATLTGVSVTAGAAATANLTIMPAAPIRYVYDQAGRLTGVVDPATDSAVYSYDSVGNVLSIARQNSSQVSILQFNPDRGYPGAAVTLYGTGFSPTPGQNTVQFNGVNAAVTSASESEIVTSVPSGASSGPITVTAPSGSAVSSAPFTIPADITATITAGGPYPSDQSTCTRRGGRGSFEG